MNPKITLIKSGLCAFLIFMTLISMKLPDEAIVFSIIIFILVFLSSTFIDMLVYLIRYKKSLNENSKTKSLYNLNS